MLFAAKVCAHHTDTPRHNAQDLNVPLTEEVAEEMIFDADLSKLDARVSYDDLIATITICTSKEVRARD